MIYNDLQKDFFDLLTRLPFVLEEQVILLFQNYEGADALPEMIEDLVRQQIIVRHTLYDRYPVICIAKDIRMSVVATMNLIRAFWPVADIGGENISYIIPSATPPQFTVQLVPDDPFGEPESGLTYDYTAVNTAEDAYLAARNRPTVKDKFPAADPQDNDDFFIYEVAVVPSEAHGEKIKPTLRKCGFHQYCFVDPKTHRAKYRWIVEEENDV